MDRNTNGSGVALYVREDTPSKQILFKNDDKDIEYFFVKINLRKKKWLISFSYNPHLQFIDKHLTHIGKLLNSLSSKYDDYILMGDFNAELSNNLVDSFCGSYSLKSLFKKPTCFKNSDNPTCIDLILTNRQKTFQNSTTIETGLSDFHKLTVTVIKILLMKTEAQGTYIS